MALDPNIALGIRGIELPNQLAQYAQVAQIQQAQQAQQMNALKMQEYQQEIQHNNALRQSAAPEGINPEHWQINPTKALALAKTAAETRNLGATGRHLEAQTKDLTIKALGNTFDNFTKLNPPTTAAASPQGVAAYITNLYADPLLGAVAAKQMPLEDAIKINTEGWSKDPNAWIAAHSGLTGEKLFDTLKGTRQNTAQGGVTRGETVDVYGRVVPGSAVNTPVAPLPADVEAQRIRIALASRPPPPPRAEQPLEKVVDPVTGKIVFASREEALRGRMTPAAAMESLPPKEIQKREALLPQATQSLKTVNNTMSIIGETVDKLLANPNGINGITGLVGGVTPALTDAARAAKADLEQLKNLAFVQGLTELRAASKTGAGVGNVSNREGDRFENLKASLDRSQSKEDLIASLRKLKGQADFTAQTMQEAYDSTYSYKSTAPAATQGTGGFKYLGKEGK